MATGAFGRLPGRGIGVIVWDRTVDSVHGLLESGDGVHDGLDGPALVVEGANGYESSGQTHPEGRVFANAKLRRVFANEKPFLGMQCRRWADLIVCGNRRWTKREVEEGVTALSHAQIVQR